MQVRLLKIFDPILVGLPGKKTASDICLTLTFKLFRTRVLVYHYALKGTPLKVQSADLTCDVIKKVAPVTDVLNLQTE